MINYNGLYNKEFYGDELKQNHFYDKKLHFRIIDNGTILPHKMLTGKWNWGFGGIVDEKNNYVKSSFVHSGSGDAYTPNEEIQNFNETVIYLGMFFHVWGHCITDSLKFIWFLKSEVYKKNFQNCPIVYVPMRGGGVHNFIKLLEILEVDIKNFHPIVKPTKFSQIILPDESFFLNENAKQRFFTGEYWETIERIRYFAQKNFTSLAQKKFYFFHGIHQIGEERLANYFQSKGYAIVRPETLPLETQLNILANCESFISTLGSCAHNMIFMRNNFEVIIIPRSCYLTGYQNALNDLHDMNIKYIDSSLSLFHPANGGPFCYIISKQLKEYFGDEWTGEYTEEDFAIFLSYVKYSKNVGLKESAKAMEYYAPILPEFISQLKKREDLLQKFGVNIN